MANYCIIPDNGEAFLHFVAELDVAAQYKNLLRQSRVQKVDIDAQKGTWKIHIRVPEALPETVLAQVGRHLCRHCGLSRVSFVQTLHSPAAFLEQHWNDFVDHVIGENRALRPFLQQASWTYDGSTFQIEMVGELSAELMETRGIENNIHEFFQREFAATCQVQFITCPPEDRTSCEDDYLTPEYLEALAGCSNEGKAKPAKESPVLFGRSIKNEPQEIASIQEEVRNVVLEGKLTACELKELKSGRFLLTFEMMDQTGGIAGKTFFDNKEQQDKVADRIKKGMYVRVKGTVQFDKFARDLTLFADSMCIATKPERTDDAPVKRVELHLHTRMSSLDAVVSVPQLIQTAAKWGHPAVAITDHGVVQAFPEAAEEAKKAGIKVIYGMEGYLFEQDINRARHIVILAKNPAGLRNLYRIVSLSHLKYLHRTPRIPRTILNEYREGLMLGSACEAGELIQAIIDGASDEELRRIASYYDYLEIQPTGNNAFLVREGKIADEEGLRAINRKVIQLGQELNKLVVATCDVHFLNPEDEIYRRILMAGQGYSDADKQPPLYFRTTEEMLAEFEYLGSKKAQEVVIDNPRRISEMIESFKPIPDPLYSPVIPGAEDAIRDMSYARAKELYGEPLPQIVADRLQYELNSIINHGFSVLYLIAHKLVKKSLDDGYLVGSRGSVGSSFVATMTNITEVNSLPPHWRCPQCKHSEFITDGSYGSGFDLPDKDCPECGTKMVKDGHDIPFATFLGFDGDKVPDIDLNFSGDYQPVAHKYTEELFGKDNVFRAGTIATIADKTAFGFVKNYFTDKGVDVRDAYINGLVTGCTGVKRTTGQHPGGIMVVPRDMDVHHFTPIQYPADDKNSSTITTHFDYHSISSRLVKLDILGHDDPTVIRMLEDLIGIDAKTIPFDDAATMSLFSSTEALGVTPEDLGSSVGTFGIPEYGTKFVRQMLEDTRPKKFSDLVRISGFSHGTDVWLNNAQDLIRNKVATVSETISARDDIMMYLIHTGVEPKLSFKTMESVRKGKGIKDDVAAKLLECGVPQWYIDSCRKIKYLFPRAHATAYVMMAFRIAYCKVHYPLAYYAAYFTVRAPEFDAELIVKGLPAVREKMAEIEQKGNGATVKEKALLTILEIALEMYLRGYTFHKIDLYKSEAVKFAISGNGLLPPLGSLAGLGGNAARNIVAAREVRPFSSIEDLRTRGHASKTIIDLLRTNGCLDGMSESDQMMLFA